MLKTPIDQLISELKNTPYTLIVVIFLCGTVTWLVNTSATASDLQSLAGRVDAYGAKIDRVLSLQIAETIRTTHNQYCKENDHSVRSDLQRTIDTLQADYAAITTSFYPVVRC
jgi:hypothetical protein